MSPIQLAVHYRGYAAQCFMMARRMDGAGDKMALITMAQAWVNLAVIREMPDPAHPDHVMLGRLSWQPFPTIS